MEESNLLQSGIGAGLHVAIIMDGNGRWAKSRGLPRVAGHRRGADAVRRTVEAAAKAQVRSLTLYAFSADNWKRPAAEVSTLMGLFRDYLRKEAERCLEHGIRVCVIGRRDRLPAEVVAAIEDAESITRQCRRLELRIAVDYSSRDAILAAARQLNGDEPSRETFSRKLSEAMHAPSPVSEIDLLIRTSGEQRLSDFLLWEAAYAELYFTPALWPDFGEADLEAALLSYRSRDRRFGAVPGAQPARTSLLGTARTA